MQGKLGVALSVPEHGTPYHASMLRHLVFLACGSAFLLASPSALADSASPAAVPGAAPALFACVEHGTQRYGASPSEVAGGCRPLAAPAGDWFWLGVREDKSVSDYVDLRHAVRQGELVGVWVLLLKPDSSGAVIGGPDTFEQLDLKSHRYYDCAANQVSSDAVQLIRGFRTSAEVVKAASGHMRPAKPIVHDSVDEQVAALVCEHGHPRDPLP